MPPILTLILVTLLFSTAIIIGVSRNRRFRRKELLHLELAEELGLKVAYLNDRDFDLFGEYRGYPLQIEPIALPEKAKAKHQTFYIRVSLPMVNPNLKSLRIVKAGKEPEPLDTHRPIDRPIGINPEIAPWLELSTNDAMFSGLILSDDIKISLFEVFRPLESGLVFLQDEELTALLPFLISSKESLNQVKAMTDLLADMKDQLN
ncbi:MAG: hypothetical protein AAF804_19685 [Bacteroidota bacterium]